VAARLGFIGLVEFCGCRRLPQMPVDDRRERKGPKDFNRRFLFCQKEKGMNKGNNTKSSSQKRYV